VICKVPKFPLVIRFCNSFNVPENLILLQEKNRPQNSRPVKFNYFSLAGIIITVRLRFIGINYGTENIRWWDSGVHGIGDTIVGFPEKTFTVL
jgi:hypothetical protein